MVQVTGNHISLLFVFNILGFTGSYTQTSNEGYEDFLKKLNVGFILRKAAMASTPVMTIAEVQGCPYLSFDFYLSFEFYNTR